MRGAGDKLAGKRHQGVDAQELTVDVEVDGHDESSSFVAAEGVDVVGVGFCSFGALAALLGCELGLIFFEYEINCFGDIVGLHICLEGL